jgi:hypothetical protein
VFRRCIGVISLLVAFLAWLIPVFMLPFVNVLPYLHATPLWHRFVWSAVFYVLAFAVARAMMTDLQWQAIRVRTLRDRKEVIGVLLGLLLAVYLAANLSANTLGVLTEALASDSFARDLVVTSSKSTGSSFKAVQLELLSLPPESSYYEITLSKRSFGDVPVLKSGDLIRIEGTQNVFGVYVSRVTPLK